MNKLKAFALTVLISFSTLTMASGGPEWGNSWEVVLDVIDHKFDSGGFIEHMASTYGGSPASSSYYNEWDEEMQELKDYFGDNEINSIIEEYMEKLEHMFIDGSGDVMDVSTSMAQKNAYIAETRIAFDKIVMFFSMSRSVTKLTPSGITAKNAAKVMGALSKKAKTKKQKKEGGSKSANTAFGGASASVEKWKYDNGSQGMNYKLSPSYSTSIGDDTELKLSVPIGMSISDVDRVFVGDKAVFDIGIDAIVKHNLTEEYFVGLHGYIGDVYARHIHDEQNIIFGTIGGFAGLNYELTEGIDYSLGVIVDYTMTEKTDFNRYQSNMLMGVGQALAIELTDEIAITPSWIFFEDADIHNLRPKDLNWYEVGLDFTYTPGDLWTITLGAKQTCGYKDFSASEVHLGAGFAF